MKRLILTTLCLLILLPAFASESPQVEGGLLFRSYEVAPNLRTSLRIPANEHGNIHYDGYLSLSFDLKIDTKKECFGYVCRILLDSNEYADIVLTNPIGGDTHLALASRKCELRKIGDVSGDSLNEWNRIEICLCTKGNVTEVIVNGVNHHLIYSEDPFKEAAIYFGANNTELFSTSDVAPMSIRNVSLSTNKRSEKVYYWKLTTEDDIQSGTGGKKMPISVKNPEWMIESNSSWQLSSSFTFNDKVKIVVDNNNGNVHLITSNCVATHIPDSKRTIRHNFNQDINFSKLTNDFIALPDGRLIYIDTEGEDPKISEFDFDAKTWTPEIKKTRHSSRLHHNVFYNRTDSSVVDLFGYGFHKYSNRISVWNESEGSFRKWTLDSIPPRYLSAVGLSDSLAWIYGGKGNAKGVQELGTTIYNDLYTISLNDYSIRKICTTKSDKIEVAAADLIISDENKTITALFYSPNEYPSNLQMKEINIEDGKFTVLGDKIPYYFLDVDSEARLIYDKATQTYYAIVIQRAPDSTYNVNIYKIKSPVIAAGDYDTAEQGRSLWVYLCVLATISLVAAALLPERLRKRKQKQEIHPVEQSESTQRHGIYLIGGFKVIDRNGVDISSDFTPLMKQLLSILILYSYNRKGISNAELKETLWDDKSEESYYNNRGVNIKKIRTCISKVDDIEIVSYNGSWSINIKNSLCDWFGTLAFIESVNPYEMNTEQIDKFISTAMKGQILPEMRYDWTDRFKGQYADLIIGSLTKVSEKNSHARSPELRIRIADAILSFDSLDEYAIRLKCRALIAQKRLGIAQSTFKNFTQEYKRLMGEDFETNFNEFVK